MPAKAKREPCTERCCTGRVEGHELERSQPSGCAPSRCGRTRRRTVADPARLHEGPELEWQRKDTAVRHATSTRESGSAAHMRGCIAALRSAYCRTISLSNTIAPPKEPPYHAQPAPWQPSLVTCTVTIGIPTLFSPPQAKKIFTDAASSQSLAK